MYSKFFDYETPLFHHLHLDDAAAGEGICIKNESAWEPMVILKHFGPNHPEMPRTVPG